MKKNLVLPLLLLTMVFYSSCKENTKKESAAAEKAYSVDSKTTKINWTAYKTTAKVPVKGQFTEVTIENAKKASTPLEALNGLKFDIPVSSLFTNDATGTRDPKILEFFFGVMKNTELISGEFKVAADKTCSIDVLLNGKTANIPLQYTANSDTSLSFNGVMNLENWDALAAVASINKACEALHTGADGVSKTWSEVAVHADVLLKKN